MRREAAAIILCAVGHGPNGNLIVSDIIAVPHEECPIRKTDFIVWPGTRLAEAQDRAEETGLRSRMLGDEDVLDRGHRAEQADVLEGAREAAAHDAVGSHRGDVVAVRNAAGRELARGLTNYSSAEARLIARKPSSEIERVLGYVAEHELVHRTNLVLV